MEIDSSNSARLSNGSLPGIFRRIMQVIIYPREFFASTGWSSDFWAPLLFVTLAFAGLRLVQMPEVEKKFDDPKFKTQIAEQRKITDEEAGRLIERMRGAAPVVSVIESPVIIVAGSAGMALLLYLIGRIIFKQAIPYITVFSLTAWTGVVAAIPLLLHIPLQLYNPEWSLPTSPAYLFPKDLQNNYFVRVLTALDLFLIWQVAWLCIGISRLYKVSLNRSVSVIGTLFVCFAVLNALFAK
ncbi:MAG: hypothetical protein FJY65_06985 [Calditrichaeota bacterium]|nr:hypothetical protein [Calditrichota bacterium]